MTLEALPTPPPEPSTRRRLRRALLVGAVAQSLILAVLVGVWIARRAPEVPPLFDDLMAAAAQDASAAVSLLGASVAAAAPAACKVSPAQAERRLARALAHAAAAGCRAVAAHLSEGAGHFEVRCGDRALSVPIHEGPSGQLEFAPVRACPPFLPTLTGNVVPSTAP